jgi:hypothetical protein
MAEQSSLEMGRILAALDEGYNHDSWHGPNLRGSIRRLSAAQAAWRPAPGQNNIHEIVLHSAYWKYTIVRGLRGDPRGAFPRQGSNWFRRPDLSLSPTAQAAQWKEDVALLDEIHSQLRAAVASLSIDDLSRQLTPQYDAATLIRGIVAHDVYHAGQIQTLKHLFKSAASGSNQEQDSF